MSRSEKSYIPAAGHDWSLPLYDPLTKALGAGPARRALIEQADLKAGDRVLDVGCGTGTLAVSIKRLYPGVDVVGLDPDPKALARARRKAERAAVAIRWDRGFADTLPYPDASFDRVLSSFMFHHLQGDERGRMLREVRRVLRLGGAFCLLDFDGTESGGGGALARLLPFSHHLRGGSEAIILELLSHAGFASPMKVSEGTVLFGGVHVSYYRAGAPASEITQG